MSADLRVVYGWVRRTRETVFAWTATLPPEVYTQAPDGFAIGSLRDVHAHVAECYLWWVGHCALGRAWAGLDRPAASVPDVTAMRACFAAADAVVEAALTTLDAWDTPIDIVHPDTGPMRVSRRWLLMHPLTHEFHHKGQMLAMGRWLGHPYPPGGDTDLVPPI